MNKYDFCSTGMTHVKDNCDWTFCQEFVDFRDLEPMRFDYSPENEKTAPELEADDYYNFEQLVLKMLGGIWKQFQLNLL